MTALKDLLQVMDTHRDYDAVLLQMSTTDETTTPDYSKADAIIRCIHTPTGQQWGFHTLLLIANNPVQGFGIYGDLDTVTRAAEYQFGAKLNTRAPVPVRYNDTSFPVNLVPLNP